MRIAMSKAGGLVGSHLTKEFRARGWETIAFKREQYSDGKGLKKAVNNVNTVANLAGAGILVRWAVNY